MNSATLSRRYMMCDIPQMLGVSREGMYYLRNTFGLTQRPSVQQMWALLMAREVRAGGETVATACAVAELINRHTPQALAKAIEENRTSVLVVGGGVVPRLIRATSWDREMRQQLAELEAKTGVVQRVLLVDGKRMLERLLVRAAAEQIEDED